MQTPVFASLIVFALVLTIACFAVGNSWIGCFLLLMIGAFAYNHFNVSRGNLRVKLWWNRQHLRMIDNALAESYETKRQAEYEHDYVAADGEADFIERLQKQRRVAVAKIQRLDFELES